VLAMKVPLLSLVGFAVWAVFLVLSIGAYRVTQVLLRQVPPNGFPSGTPHGGDRYWRLNRAHVNTLESLPIFGALVLSAVLAGVQGPLVDQLAMTVLGARIGQSTAHVAGGSNLHVNVRFAFFAVQIVCFLWLAILIALALV
jgi:uncharacterized MAPEG superfamily protein